MNDLDLGTYLPTLFASISKTTIPGFMIAWEFPGAVFLHPEGVDPTSPVAMLGIVVTPDEDNDDEVLVQIDYEGLSLGIAIAKVAWTGDPLRDIETWLGVVEANRRTLERAVALARDGFNPCRVLHS